MLYLIGLGLLDEEDITLRAIECVKKCSKVYFEDYTSKLKCSLKDLEKIFNKKITHLSREFLEKNISKIVDEAKKENIALLIIGSPLAATTHFEFISEAKKKNIEFQVIENASIYNAVAITGLFLYKFGRVTTIPFENENIKSPYEVYLNNKELGLHTLFLLDIKEDKMMTVREALDYLIKQGLEKDTLCVGVAALGSDNPEIKVGKASSLKLSKFPQSLIITGELNFKEKEALGFYS